MRHWLVLLALPSIAIADDRLQPDGRVRSDARWYKEAPYLTAPADPWAAVSGDQPLRWTEAQAEKWTSRGDENPCTAREDHCLVKDAWFFASESDIERKKTRPAAQIGMAVAVIGPKSLLRPWNAQSRLKSAPYVGYRTVPATKATLVPGALAIAMKGDIPVTTAIGAVEGFWVLGVVESVDLAAGTFKLVDYAGDYPLHYARIAVLTWKEGGKVEIVGGKKRDTLAVNVKDLFLPPAKKTTP
jgi:hypothetical protein